MTHPRPVPSSRIIPPACRTPGFDELALVVRENGRSEGEDYMTPILDVDLAINGTDIPIQRFNIYELVDTFIAPGRCEICWGVANERMPGPILVRHAPRLRQIIWYVPAVLFDPTVARSRRPIHHSVYHFEERAYRREIAACLRALIQAGRKYDAKEWECLYPTLVGDVASMERALQSLQPGRGWVPVPGLTAQQRLERAVENQDTFEMLCALADGADPLAPQPYGQTCWRRACERFLPTWQDEQFLRVLTENLPHPFNDAGLRWQGIHSIMVLWGARTFQNLCGRDGPLALTPDERSWCLELIDERRAHLKKELRKSAKAKPTETQSSRRDLLELDFMEEFLAQGKPRAMAKAPSENANDAPPPPASDPVLERWIEEHHAQGIADWIAAQDDVTVAWACVRFALAYNTRDVGWLESRLAPSVSHESQNIWETLRGDDEVLDFLTSQFATLKRSPTLRARMELATVFDRAGLAAFEADHARDRDWLKEPIANIVFTTDDLGLIDSILLITVAPSPADAVRSGLYPGVESGGSNVIPLRG
ncbi:MAG TPA: hypothetical protein VFQ88_04655 [Nevskiaceae bacterium]|nr:hypothetical protein [Nevskiaceae bacterium]